MSNFKGGRHAILTELRIKLVISLFVALIFLLDLRCFSQTYSISIIEPQDETITYNERLNVKGNAAFVNEITINGLKIGVKSDGAFSAGLRLHPGKNLVEIKAFKDGKEILKRIRILREITFPDIESLYRGKKHWARQEIIEMSTLGIVEGYPDNTFLPRRTISRGELATWIARAKDLLVKELVEDVFFDVPKEHWRAPYIRAIIDVGYMDGSSLKSFGIGENMLRGRIAKVIDKVESLNVPDRIDSSPFLDVPLDHPEAAAIYAAFRGKMVIGVSKVKRIYQPNRAMNRAEATVLLSRVRNVLDKLRSLDDFEKGYDVSALCNVNTPPTVQVAAVDPSVISNQSKVLLTFTAKIVDLQGQADISEVKIDLSSIGGPPNAKMYDDGTHDDIAANDGTYTLRIGMQPGVTDGVKYFKVFVTDKGGLTATATIRLEVKK